MAAFILLVALTVSASATPQTDLGALAERVRSINSATATPAACDAQMSRATLLNGPDLFYGSGICHAAGRPVEASFLLNAAQTRSIVDLVLIVPASRADSLAAADLSGFIFFVGGGLGDDQVLREPAARERFFALLDGWSPVYSAQYDPGWSARRRPDAATYQAAVAESKGERHEQLADLARLYADDSYYRLHRRLADLQAQTSGTYVEGSPEAVLSRELQRQMAARAEALGIMRYAEAPVPNDDAEPRFPPPAPEPDETIAVAADDAVTRRCADIADRLAIGAGAEVIRVLITRSPEWGTIWRADMAGGDDPETRFTCTETTSSSEPLEGASERLPALPVVAAPPRE